MGQKQDEEHTAVRWWLVITFSGLGTLVLVGAALVSYGHTRFKGEDASFWSGLLVNIGTSLLLAAVLVWFERTIVRNVREQTRSTVRKVEQAVTTVAATAATDAAEKTAAALQPRLADLDARLRARSESQASERTATAAKVGEVPSFEALRDALRVASSINAVADSSFSDEGGEVIVPAGEALDAPLVLITYVPEAEDRITLAHLVDRAPQSSVTWQKGQAPEDVFASLQEQMVKDGGGPAARRMSVQGLFGNLASVLTDATSGRQADEDAWLSGSRVREMVADGYIITEAGVEVRDYGIVVRPEHFGYYDNFGNVLKSSVPDLPPNGIDLEIWATVVERAQGYFVTRPLGFYGVSNPPF